MKYLILSAVFHFGLFTAVFAAGWSSSSSKDQAEPVLIEIKTVESKLPTTPPLEQRVSRVFSAPQESIERIVPEMVESLMKEKPSAVKSPESEGAPLDYVEELRAYLEKNKNYPKSALRLRQSGVVQLRLVISDDGNFDHIEILAPSPFDSLNNAALNLVSDLKRFKPLPEELRGDGEFIVPIAYQLKGSAF